MFSIPLDRERLLRTVFNQAFQFIVVADLEGTVLEVNRTALQFIGADAGDVRGRKLWEGPLWPEAAGEPSRLREAFEAARRGQMGRFEVQTAGPMGEERWIDMSLKPIEDDTGEITLVVCEGRDITGRVHSEHDLQQTHDQLEATLNALPDLFFEVDTTGCIHDFRAPIPELLALPPEQFLGKRVGEIMPPEVCASIMEALRGARVAPTGTSVGVTYSLQTPQGVGWFEPSAAVKGELRGEDTRFVVLVRDVTGRVRVEHELRAREEALRESETKYRTIFATSGHAMVIFDDDGRIELANRELEKLTGYGPDEIAAGLTWMQLFDQKSLEKMMRYHQVRSHDPASVRRSYEATLLDREGREHQGIVVVDLIPGTTQRVAAFVDLTERRRAEQHMLHADKMAALGQIIAGVAHEINNPNNFIHFNLPILRRYLDAIRPMLEHHLEEDPQLKILNMPYEVFLEDMFKLLENMQHGSERITGIVSELKDYIRGHEADERRPERLETLFDHVMVLVGKQVQKMVRRFDVDLEPKLPPVAMNLGRIEQVLINLIINAGQAADKQDSWVRLCGRRVADDPAWVEIAVQDNGAGITEEVQRQIFDPFFTTKGREAGTGLGLSISQRIVEEHGGDISVKSAPGEGTLFTVRLPAVTDAAAQSDGEVK